MPIFGFASLDLREILDGKQNIASICNILRHFPCEVLCSNLGGFHVVDGALDDLPKIISGHLLTIFRNDKDESPYHIKDAT